MKKFTIVLNTPARVAIALGLIVLVSELLIMVLLENISTALLKDPFLTKLFFYAVDPILLTTIVAPALYLLNPWGQHQIKF